MKVGKGHLDKRDDQSARMDFPRICHVCGSLHVVPRLRASPQDVRKVIAEGSFAFA